MAHTMDGNDLDLEAFDSNTLRWRNDKKIGKNVVCRKIGFKGF